MKFLATSLADAYVVEPERLDDDRGFFARSWCQRELAGLGLNGAFVQSNVAFSRQAGTVRGLHFQTLPHAEAKLVRCTRGAVWDVIVDLRRDSPTHKRWIAVELTEDNHTMLYVPEGFAHGYETLTNDSEIAYETSAFYVPDAARGVRFDDPAFAITWPRPVTLVSARDQSWPDYPR